MNAQNMALAGPNPTTKKKLFIPADYLILAAAGLSFLLSVGLWFSGSKEQGVYVGLWVPSIISLGVYFRVMVGAVK